MHPPPSESPIRVWMTWDDFEEYAVFTRDLLEATREAYEAGKSVDEVAASVDLQQRYPDYDLTRTARSVEAIYDELRLSVTPIRR